MYIGIDGGQTSTKCVIAAPDLTVIGEGMGGGLIHLAAEQGEQTFVNSLREAVQAAWQAAGLPPQPVRAMVMGLTGVDGAVEADTAERLAQRVVPCPHIRAHNDAYTALIGAHDGQPGIIVISGTGAIALGQDASGRTARAGGWGWLIGDEGSAMAMGRAALNAITHAHDGTGPRTQLTEAVLRQLGIQALRDCKRIVYGPAFGARGFAALAPAVGACADAGDAVAQQIVAQAGQALARLAVGVADALAMPDAPVAPVSGAFGHVRGLRAAFTEALGLSKTHRLTVVSPHHSAALGAAFLARQIDSTAA